jgi:NADPH:quinone reductase
MRSRALTFPGYAGLRQTQLPEPQPLKGRGAGPRHGRRHVTPLDHTVLSGRHPRAKAPPVPGNEGAGVIEDTGESGFAVGSRVMFTAPYGVGENDAWQDRLPVRSERLGLAPDMIDWRPIRERNR